MRITLLSETSLRLEPAPGMLSVEAPRPDASYSPFHMLASGLAACTWSVLRSWAEQAKLDVETLAVEVSWAFAEDPHRVGSLAVTLTWPTLQRERRKAAERVAATCAVKETLAHSPAMTIEWRTTP
jgi:uncharacterized OsmC-like protein